MVLRLGSVAACAEAEEADWQQELQARTVTPSVDFGPVFSETVKLLCVEMMGIIGDWR